MNESPIIFVPQLGCYNAENEMSLLLRHMKKHVKDMHQIGRSRYWLRLIWLYEEKWKRMKLFQLLEFVKSQVTPEQIAKNYKWHYDKIVKSRAKYQAEKYPIIEYDLTGKN